jgi:hypothetical protein
MLGEGVEKTWPEKGNGRSAGTLMYAETAGPDRDKPRFEEKKNKWYERRVADKRFRAPLVLQVTRIVVSFLQNMTKYYYAVSLRCPGTPRTLGIAGYGFVVDERLRKLVYAVVLSDMLRHTQFAFRRGKCELCPNAQHGVP